MAATLAVALGATLMQWAPWRSTVSALVHRLTIDLGVEATLRTDVGTAAVLSSDGQLLAFAAQPLGGNQSFLYVRRLDQLTATQLPGTADARGPFFSPDGAWIAFFAEGKLKKIETRGGSPLTLCDALNPRGGDWTEDGRIVFLPVTGGGQGLKQVPAAGGVPTAFIDADPSGSQRWPQVLPGGGAVLDTRIQPGTTASLYVQRLPSGERRRLRAGEYGRVLPSGHLLFIENGALFATPFDQLNLSVPEDATRILDGVAIDAINGAQFAAGSGTLIYRAGAASGDGAPLDWLDARGTVTSVVADPADWLAPRFSPDGRRLAFQLAGAGGLWTLDVARRVKSQVVMGLVTTGVAGGPSQSSTAWTPDGQRLVFTFGENGGVPNLHWRRADGSGGVQRLAQSPYQQSHLPGTRVVAGWPSSRLLLPQTTSWS